MEQLLIYIVALVVLALIVVALLRWWGVVISPIVYEIGGYLVVGVIIVVLIRLLWPLLAGGDLSLPSLK